MKKTNKPDIRIDTLILYGLVLLTTLLTLGLGTLSALTASYKALFRRLKTEGDETDRVQTFIKDMKKSMPESLLTWLVLVALLIGGSVLLTHNDSTYVIIGVILIIESLIVVFYGAAGLALFNYRRVIYVFKTALLMGHLHILTTAKLFAGIIFTAALAYLLSPLVILVTFPFIIYVSAHAFYPIFRIYIRRIEADQELEESDNKQD